MDAERFDQIARSLTTGGTRRAALRFFSALPLLGGPVASETEQAAEAAKRGKRGKQAGHKRHLSAEKKRKKHHKKKCKPKPIAATCAGKCGPVKNTCKKTVDCGSCACDPPCDPCFRCDKTTRTCQLDPAQQGDGCGEPGQVCQANGSCACDDTSCASGQRCLGEVCVCDGASCPDGCCDGTTCHVDDDAACGSNGGACAACTAPHTCGGGGVPGGCGCTPLTTCPGNANCGTVDDECGGTLTCGGCTIPGQQCCDGVCQACCDGTDCPPCHTCSGGACVPVANQTLCAVNLSTTSICCNGVCCDGCCGGDGACGPCRVFVTNEPGFVGNLGGLAGADAICQARAAAASLPGAYKAWLSTGTGPNESPATGRFRQSGQPYTLLNGTPIADDWADLTSGTLDAPIDVIESGVEVALDEAFVWTHTLPDGTAGGQFGTDCAGWTNADIRSSGDVGIDVRSDAFWTKADEFSPCHFGNRLYCFQQT